MQASVSDMLAGMAEMARPLRILAFEPFDAGSHRAVRESITLHSRHQWHWITRPGRAWKWRMRLAAVEVIDDAQRAGVLDEPIDAIFVTSLMSIADLRAMLPRHRRELPIILSMHENQAAYPEGATRWSDESNRPDVQFALTNLTSILAADHVIWNSEWNRQSFVTGIEAILSHAPDLALHDVAARIQQRSQIIWPPVEVPPAGIVRVLHNSAGDKMVHHRDDKSHGTLEMDTSSRSEPIRIVWPHRWEHDKGPDELLRIAREHSDPMNLRWTILGERYREVPPALIEFQREFAQRIDHCGFVPDRSLYWQHLTGCDWVLSTSRHEFFGIAVVEAMFAGCLPWLPDRLSYPELLPPEARLISPMSLPHAGSSQAQSIRDTIIKHLGPATAANAVGELDAAISQAAIAAEAPCCNTRSNVS